MPSEELRIILKLGHFPDVVKQTTSVGMVCLGELNLFSNHLTSDCDGNAIQP